MLDAARAHQRLFASAILDGTPLACPGEQAFWTDRVLQTVLSANQSRT